MNLSRYSLLYTLVLLVLFSACKSEVVKKKKEEESMVKLIEVRVVKAMGEAIADSIQYLPLIGSIAQAKKKEDGKYSYLVIGKNIHKSDNLSVRKVATLVYSQGQEEKRLFLAFPEDAKRKTLDANTFDEFATNYISIKWQIETWYNHFAGIGNSKFIRWELIND